MPTTFESFTASPFGVWTATRYEGNGVNQVYTTKLGSGRFTCITCTPPPGAPGVDRNKFMVNWHPSGRWLTLAVEKVDHDWAWLPQSWQRGFLQTGVWMNMRITAAVGDRWYQMTDFKKPDHGPSDGLAIAQSATQNHILDARTAQTAGTGPTHF